MNILKFVLTLIAASLAAFYLITGNFIVMPYMIFSLGLMMLAMGFSELEKKRKSMAYFLFIAAVFSIFVSNYIFFL